MNACWAVTARPSVSTIAIWIPAAESSTLGGHTFKDPYAIPIAAAHFGYEL